MNEGWDVVPGPDDHGEAAFLDELLHAPDAPDLDAGLRREIHAAADGVLATPRSHRLRRIAGAGRRERFLWWLGDWSHWAGWVNDPAEVETATAWLSLHWVQLSCWRNGRTDGRDRALLKIFRLPLKFRLAVAVMWR